jgi:uncharacterized protein (DUF2267 family)
MRKDEFLARVQKAGGTTSRREAERWSKVVLSALAELVKDAAERRHFISQLPGFLKSHLLAETPRSLSTNRDAFVRHVGAQLGVHAVEAERVLTVVYAVLAKAVSLGATADFEEHVPREIAGLLGRLRH